MSTLPKPTPDGGCVVCGASDFMLARDRIEYSPCVWNAKIGLFVAEYGHTENSEADDAVRFFCQECGEYHIPPEGVL